MFDNLFNNVYWYVNMCIILISFVIWVLVLFGFGILLCLLLSGIFVGGIDFGFWFVQ